LPASRGRRRWRWTYSNDHVEATEERAVSSLDYGPLIVASTFKDYAHVAAAFNARAEPRVAITPRVKALADELTKNVSGVPAQAKAIYDWVAINIQYANNQSGIGAVVPHPADLVIANRMGDCKDHSILMQALLGACIASVPVLINANNTYSLPPVATPDFDHLIIYIPSLNLYADSTSRYAPFGSLPFEDSDKPVVHTIDFTEVERTPARGYKQNRLEISTDLVLHPDGNADGTTTTRASGIRAETARLQFSILEPNCESRWCARFWRAMGSPAQAPSKQRIQPCSQIVISSPAHSG
jgi:hypothetical protein